MPSLNSGGSGRVGALRELAAYRATQVRDADGDWMFQGRRAGRRLTTAAKKMRARTSTPCASSWAHASVTTTQLYLRTNEDAKRAAAGKGLF
jgi:hypothetical protein